MTTKEWTRLDARLARLQADRLFKHEQPEEWLAQVRWLQVQLSTPIND